MTFKIKNLNCTLNMPKKLKYNKKDGKEIAQGLPPYAPVNSYPVDMYPACPSNWMHGSDMASSYFVPVEAEKGMWLDFNDCFNHSYDVAIVISIQGINPITGKKTDQLRLEQYKNKCPVHNIAFQQDRFCPKCGYKWPGQNYLCTTNTPNGSLWLDGFRTSNGEIRQYVFTEEEAKGIAHQLIGEDKVYAIGIAFYQSKEKKKELPKTDFRFPDNLWYHHIYSSYPTYPCLRSDICWKNSTNFDKIGPGREMSHSINFCCQQNNRLVNDITDKVVKNNDKIEITCNLEDVSQVDPVKNLEIGAGATIKQDIYDDEKNIDYWEEKPYGMIYINYCDKETCKKILEAGKREEKTNGFLQNTQTID